MEKIKDITKAVNRGINKSSSIYTAVKNKTLAAMNITVIIRVRPVWSNIILKLIGFEGVKKKSHDRISVILCKKINIKRGKINVNNKVRDRPAFTGCHIYLRQRDKVSHGMSRNHFALHFCL